MLPLKLRKRAIERALRAALVTQRAPHALRLGKIPSESLEPHLLRLGFVQSVLYLRQSLDFFVDRLYYELATLLWGRTRRVLLPLLFIRSGSVTPFHHDADLLFGWKLPTTGPRGPQDQLAGGLPAAPASWALGQGWFFLLRAV